MTGAGRAHAWAVLLTTCALGVGAAGPVRDAGNKAGAVASSSSASAAGGSPAKAKPDLSGRKQVGKASFYAKKFAGRKMADGTPMDPRDDNAASKTLPLGSKAKVTNLATGQSAVVTIQDRGPYVPGRIVDLSPATARQIGLSQDAGVADVEVAPIRVPMPDGSVKAGVAAADALATPRAPSDPAR